MRTLARASLGAADAASGGFLDPVFRPLEAAKIRVRQGTATFVAGPPGAFKTGFVLYWALRLQKTCCYFSADSESFEMVERSAAAITGDTMDQVRANPAKYTDALAEHAGGMRFVYEDSPTYEDIELELSAYAEVFGEFPEVIVIDNLMNVVGEEDNEWSSMRTTARFIHRLTRITKAAVFVLHHMADDRNDPTTPAPRSKMQGKVGQLPKVILSLALAGNELRVAAAKNRFGPADASGQTYATLYVDPSRNRIFNSYTDLMSGVPA